MSNAKTHDRLMPPLWIFTLISSVLIVWVLAQLKELLVLLVVGYCIAYVMNPFLSWLEKRRVPRVLAFFVVTLGAVGILGLLALTAIPTIANQYEKLSTNFPAYVQTARERALPILEEVKHHLPAGAELGEALESPMGLLQNLSGETLKRFGAGLLSALLGGYSLTLTLVNLTLLPLFVFYLAVDFKGLHQGVLGLFPGARRKLIQQIASDIDAAISAFLRGQFTVGCILSALYAAGLGLVGVDLWFLLALISGFGNFIPYLGFVVGIVLSTIMALVTFGTLGAVLKVWAVYAVVQMLEGTVITPRVVGTKVGLSPLAVILAIFAGGQLLGLLGVLLAVPGAAIMRVLAVYLHRWVLTRAD